MWILEVRSEEGCGKWHFLVWNKVRIWRTRLHTPTENYPEYPLGSETALSFFNFLIVKVMGEASGSLERVLGLIYLRLRTRWTNETQMRFVKSLWGNARPMCRMFYTLSFCVLRLGQPVFVLFALFLLCFNIIIPCGIISRLPPYKTLETRLFL